MELRNFLKRAVVIPAVAASAVLAAAMWPSASASATTGDAEAGAPQPAVTLSQNSSYVTTPYFGVLHVSTGDSTVACASSDSQNRLIVTAVGTGSTTISFWYKQTDTGNWISTFVPVTVTGASSSQATSTQAYAYGVTFAPSAASIAVGTSITPTDIRVSGFSVEASSLLWVSSSDVIAAVDKSSGAITGVNKGTAIIYAIDPSTKSCGTYTVTVS